MIYGVFCYLKSVYIVQFVDSAYSIFYILSWFQRLFIFYFQGTHHSTSENTESKSLDGELSFKKI